MKSVEIRDEIQKEHNKFQQLSHANAGVSGGYFLFNVMHRRFVQVDANVIQQQHTHRTTMSRMMAMHAPLIFTLTHTENLFNTEFNLHH